jgi:hypothetical protein
MLTLAIKSRFGRPFNADTWPINGQAPLVFDQGHLHPFGMVALINLADVVLVIQALSQELVQT